MPTTTTLADYKPQILKPTHDERGLPLASGAAWLFTVLLILTVDMICLALQGVLALIALPFIGKWAFVAIGLSAAWILLLSLCHLMRLFSTRRSDVYHSSVRGGVIQALIETSFYIIAIGGFGVMVVWVLVPAAVWGGIVTLIAVNAALSSMIPLAINGEFDRGHQAEDWCIRRCQIEAAKCQRYYSDIHSGQERVTIIVGAEDLRDILRRRV